jgi:hypothetical protein
VDEEYAKGYKDGWEDHKVEVHDQTRKYALALFALMTIKDIITAFVKDAFSTHPNRH